MISTALSDVLISRQAGGAEGNDTALLEVANTHTTYLEDREGGGGGGEAGQRRGQNQGHQDLHWDQCCLLELKGKQKRRGRRCYGARISFLAD